MPASFDFSARIAAIDEELRSVASAAAKAGHWPMVRALSSAAESLQPVIGASGATPEPGGRTRRAVARGTRTRTRKSDVYPRFLIENEDLVKVGWSKREREEYRHRAPRAVVLQVASAIATLSGPSGTFAAGDLLPVLLSDGASVPDYQAYLALRWFRQLGLVEQQGRTGYGVPAPDGLPVAVGNQLMQLAAGGAGNSGGSE